MKAFAQRLIRGTKIALGVLCGIIALVAYFDPQAARQFLVVILANLWFAFQPLVEAGIMVGVLAMGIGIILRSFKK